MSTRILSIDPSLSCSGWAVVTGTARDPKILTAGMLRLKAEDLPERVMELFFDVQGLLDEFHPTAAVVEMPQTFSFGMGGKRSAATLPGYGMATAAALLACRTNRVLMTPGRVLSPSASVWTRGYPKTKGDPNKQSRVHHAALLFGTIPQFFGAKSNAGNVADAALLGHWALGQMEAKP